MVKNLKIKFGLTAVMALGLFAVGSGVASAAPAADETIKISDYFPDARFQQAISRGFYFNQTGSQKRIDTNQDGYLTPEERNAVYKMYMNLADTTYQGIDAFPNLTVFEITGRTGVTDLDLSENTALREVTIENPVVNVKLPENNSIEFFDNLNSEMSDAQVANLLAQLPNLTSYSQNYKRDENLYNTTLDFSNNPKLEDVTAMNGYYKAVDVSNCPNLKKAVLSYCDVSSIDISNNPKLTTLDLTGAVYLENLDVANNPKLEVLGLSGTGLSTIDTSDMKNLVTFYGDHSEINQVDLSQNTKLQDVKLGYARLSSIDLAGLTDLKSIDISSNHISSLDVKDNSNIQSLLADNNQLTTLDVDNLKNLVTLSVNQNQLKSIDVTNNSLLSQLGVAYNQLSSLDLSNNKTLTNLYAEHNQILDVNFSSAGAPSMSRLANQEVTVTPDVDEDGAISANLSSILSGENIASVEVDSDWMYSGKRKLVVYEGDETNPQSVLLAVHLTSGAIIYLEVHLNYAE